jgi:hypothetical protein
MASVGARGCQELFWHPPYSNRQQPASSASIGTYLISQRLLESIALRKHQETRERQTFNQVVVGSIPTGLTMVFLTADARLAKSRQTACGAELHIVST